MPLDLFGFTIKRTKAEELKSDVGKSFVSPDLDDGAQVVTVGGGGVVGQFMSFDTPTQSPADQIKMYRNLALKPEIELAVEDIVNEAIVTAERKLPVQVILDNVDLSDNIKTKVADEFDNVLKLLKFQSRGHEIFRKWYVDGRIYYHMVINEKNKPKGIQELRPVDPLKMQKIRVEHKKKDQKLNVDVVTGYSEFYLFNQTGVGGAGDQTGVKVSKDSVAYVPSGLFDSSKKNVLGYLHKALKPANQLGLIEDASIIYRISRAPERRVFYIDVGNLPKTKAEQYLKSIMTRYRSKLMYDASTGEIADNKHHQSILEDFWLPRREGGRGTEISTLDGGANLGEIEDIVYFQKKLYQALNVPVSRLNPEEQKNGLGRATEISRDELKFSKFIDKLRNKFAGLFLQILKTQLIVKRILKEAEWNEIVDDIHFNFLRDTFFTELKEAELLRERMDTLQSVNDYIGRYYSVEWVRKNILRQTDAEMAEIDAQIAQEKDDGLLTSINDTDIVNGRVDTVANMDALIDQGYYSKTWIRKNILRQTDEDIAEIDSQIAADRVAGENDPAGADDTTGDF